MLVQSRTAASSPPARTPHPLLTLSSPSPSPHHVPHVVGQPVDDGIAATHKLQVLGLGRFLRHEENHKAGGHEGHGHDDEDGDDHVCALQPGHKDKSHQITGRGPLDTRWSFRGRGWTHR